MKKQKPMVELLIFSINNQDKTTLFEILSKHHSVIQLSFPGKGAAETNAADFWGFSVVDKEIVFAIVPFGSTKLILEEINQALKFYERHNGIGFSIPLSSATTNLVQSFIKKENSK